MILTLILVAWCNCVVRNYSKADSHEVGDSPTIRLQLLDSYLACNCTNATDCQRFQNLILHR